MSQEDQITINVKVACFNSVKNEANTFDENMEQAKILFEWVTSKP